MSRHKINFTQVKDKEPAIQYQCQKCSFILQDAVQTTRCGHLLCEHCIQVVLKEKLPVCPVSGCEEPFTKEVEGEQPYFCDNFVRREIRSLDILCKWSSKGCLWEGKIKDYEEHLGQCERVGLAGCERAGVAANCSCEEVCQCPLSPLGCEFESQVKEKVCDHLYENMAKQLDLIAQPILEVMSSLNTSSNQDDNDPPEACNSLLGMEEEEEYACTDEGYGSGKFQQPAAPEDGPKDSKEEVLDAALSSHKSPSASDPAAGDLEAKYIDVAKKNLRERDDLRKWSEKVSSLKTTVTQIQRDVRLLDIKNKECNLDQMKGISYDGNKIWKISNFEQHKIDAHEERHQSMQDSFFYTSRHGYKLRLLLYIMGHTTAAANHMSLFLNVMKGEYDRILKWPFRHNAVFMLISQSSKCDVVQVALPKWFPEIENQEPDVHYTFGYPNFISHEELVNKGFVKDDTIFIKCVVDTDEVHK